MPSNLETYLEQGKMYQSLTVKDLLEARDAYHVFLTRKKNVIGTAIGKFRFREKGVPETKPMTIENSEVRNYSWPCLLVFVQEWIAKGGFGGKGASYNDYVPKSLYLPDGREIPVCVILASWKNKGSDALTGMKYPGSVIGGGYPIMTRVQGEERWATLGCLVSDGRITYGLTNAHVTGRTSEPLFTVANGNEKELGVSSDKRVQKVEFAKAFEGLSGKHTMVNMDIGLIELHDLHGVTSQIFGVGEVRGVVDVNHDTLSLKLIGCPVLGYGCSSGEMKGEIAALFYRYASAGGYDYVADYFIGPRRTGKRGHAAPFSPRNGDSGTVLVIDDENSNEHMKVIGVLWGGQKDTSDGKEQPYGLVTNFGTICRFLDVELVCGWNTGYDRYFGAYAHVVLPSLCAGVLKNKKLKKLMENNIDSYSMPLIGTSVKQTQGLSKKPFVPLSDVPDLVWKLTGSKFIRGSEGPNHFADMDQPNKDDNNRTLLDLCNRKANIDPDVWLKYYDAVKAKEKGALPFRIAQIYDAMERYASKGNVAGFVCSAGILTHYVFDACMPLHISYMHHGDPDGPKKTVIRYKKKKIVSIADDVHAEFDNEMVEYYVSDIDRDLPGLVDSKAKANIPVSKGKVKSARDAAAAAVALMRDTVRKHINPIEIAKYYEELVGMDKRDRCDIFWDKYGKGYQEAMAEGVVLAARLWEAAWVNGNGDKNIKNTSAVPQARLRKLYETKKGFLDSVPLREIKNYMRWDGA